MLTILTKHIFHNNYPYSLKISNSFKFLNLKFRLLSIIKCPQIKTNTLAWESSHHNPYTLIHYIST